MRASSLDKLPLLALAARLARKAPRVARSRKPPSPIVIDAAEGAARAAAARCLLSERLAGILTMAAVVAGGCFRGCGCCTCGVARSSRSRSSKPSRHSRMANEICSLLRLQRAMMVARTTSHGRPRTPSRGTSSFNASKSTREGRVRPSGLSGLTAAGLLAGASSTSSTSLSSSTKCTDGLPCARSALAVQSAALWAIRAHVFSPRRGCSCCCCCCGCGDCFCVGGLRNFSLLSSFETALPRGLRR